MKTFESGTKRLAGAGALAAVLSASAGATGIVMPDEQAATEARLRARAMMIVPQARTRDEPQIQRAAPGTRVCEMNIGTAPRETDPRRPSRGVARSENVVIMDGPSLLICP